MIIKTTLEHLIDILNSQNQKIVACDIDLVTYNRKAIIVKDVQQSAYFTKKIEEIKAVKKRAEETIEVINKRIDEETKKEKKKQPN